MFGNSGGRRTAQKLGSSKLTTEKQEAVGRNERVTGRSERAEIIRQLIGRRLRKAWQNISGKTTGPLDKDPEGWIDHGEEIVREFREMGCSYEIAIELTSLTLYDVAILIGMFWC